MAQGRDEQASDARITAAWITATLSRAKKIPPLATLLTKSRGRPQTMSEQRAMLNILAGQYGIPLRKGSARGR